MSLGDTLIKFGGIVLFVVGLCLILSVVGVNFLGIGLAPAWLAVVVGIVFIAAGVVLIRGGSISL